MHGDKVSCVLRLWAQCHMEGSDPQSRACETRQSTELGPGVSRVRVGGEPGFRGAMGAQGSGAHVQVQQGQPLNLAVPT